MSAVATELLLHEFADYLIKRPGGKGLAARQRVLADLERAGYRAGRQLTERLSLGKTELLAGEETAIKFACVTLWKALHGKQASRLSKVKAASAYIITDSSFPPFECLAAPEGVDVRDRAGKYAFFSKGALKGCLAALGLDAIVDVDWTASFPAVTFHVALSSEG